MGKTNNKKSPYAVTFSVTRGKLSSKKWEKKLAYKFTLGATFCGFNIAKCWRKLLQSDWGTGKIWFFHRWLIGRIKADMFQHVHCKKDVCVSLTLAPSLANPKLYSLIKSSCCQSWCWALWHNVAKYFLLSVGQGSRDTDCFRLS